MDPLDGLPIEVLLALQEAVADPSEAGRVRAAKRAEGAGFHIRYTPATNGLPEAVLRSVSPPRFDPEPIPMEEAEEGVESLWLRFDR